ncbi:MAG: sortase [Bacillota bacterium]
MNDRRSRRGSRPRRVTIGNLLLIVGALVLLTPLLFTAYEEILYRIEMGQVPETSPVLLTATGEAATEPVPPAPAPPESSAEPSAPPPEKPAESTAPAPAAGSPSDPVTPMQFDRSKGIPVYQIEIPRIGVKYLVGEGIDNPVLAKGPGHYPQTVLPGENGNAALAGHRTIRGRPAFFYAINELQPGDEIRIGYRDKTLTYVVERNFLTTPYDLSVLRPLGYPALTLTTCDPPGSDERRLIIQSRLVKITDNP